MRDRTLLVILILVGLFNFADYWFTLQAVQVGFREANPFMDAILHTHWFAVVKLVAVPVGLIYVWVARKKTRDGLKRAFWIPASAYSLLLIYHWIVVFPRIM